MKFTDYSDKSFLICGDDTKDHKESIKTLGGKWNSTLKGWIFPKTKDKLVKEWLDGVSKCTKKSIAESNDISINSCFIVSGKDTIKYKSELKEFGGTWNGTLQGWIFAEKEKEKITKWLNKTKIETNGEEDETDDEVEDADE